MFWIAKFIISLLMLVFIIWVGVSNLHYVEFNLYPDFLYINNFKSFDLPLFIILIFSIFLGFLFGCILEYSRAKKLRISLRNKEIELKKSNLELNNIKKEIKPKNDDILSLLK